MLNAVPEAEPLGVFLALLLDPAYKIVPPLALVARTSTAIPSGLPGDRPVEDRTEHRLPGLIEALVQAPQFAHELLHLFAARPYLGEMSATDSLGRSASVVALEETTVLWIDRRTFRSSVASSTALSRNLSEILSKRVRLANARLIAIASLDVPGRVASQVLSLAREYGQETSDGIRIPMRLTQADLAALVGASRVSVNQALGQFRKRGAISVAKDGRVSVHDQDALARRAR